ncbi:MAG TPA: tRNA (guanosine(46)-N7)-methyltransferase TrmB [Bacteroidales bacterium]|nr:tRNA (guanosine(46)-N7)-methyltransferase TrmB [Bacteroidales bacterium]
MARNKLAKFAELETFPNVIQPTMEEALGGFSELKGNWHTQIFKNKKPIVLELGCGMGEYTTALAKHFPENNYIGIDIKGARLYHGARLALKEKLTNVAFMKTRVEFIKSFFAPGEVSEIWLTFSDPQPKFAKKRLMSAFYNEIYASISKPEAIIHVKTDSLLLYDYTLDIVKKNKLNLLFETENLYQLPEIAPYLHEKTKYEGMAIGHGKPITYVNYSLSSKSQFVEPLNERAYRQYVRAYDAK